MVHVRAYLLRTVDDEITSRVQGTLVEFTKVSVCQATQQAVCWAKHDGNFTNEGFLVLSLNLVLTLLYDGLCDVYVQGGRVPEEVGGNMSEQVEYRLKQQEQVRPTWGSVVEPHWASWGTVLHLSPSAWAWTDRFAQTSAGNEAERKNKLQWFHNSVTLMLYVFYTLSWAQIGWLPLVASEWHKLVFLAVNVLHVVFLQDNDQ